MQRRFKRHDPHTFQRGPGELRVALEIIQGQAKHRFRPIEAPAYLIGAAPDCDLVLGDPQFPEVHSCIRIKDGKVTVRHLGFSPNLVVNGRLISHARLIDGDQIQTGSYQFGVHIDYVETELDDPQQQREVQAVEVYREDRVNREMGEARLKSLLHDIRICLDENSDHMRIYRGQEEIQYTDIPSPRCTTTAALNTPIRRTGSL